MPDCIFCRIARREIPAQVVAENEGAIAFRDIKPICSTHILVIPKEHVADSAAQLDASRSADLIAIFELATKVAAMEKLEKGWRLVTNVGEYAGQTVHHVHFHLLGGEPLGWPPA